MKKYKVCVYAICKNEEKFAEKWMRSMSEADEIYVLDTGSTDNTVKILTDMGAKVKVQPISPWRFDVARNTSLALVPKDADILVCTDLDEVFETGWRNKVENFWDEETSCIKYRYTWGFNPDGSEGSVFWIEKIHANGMFRWEHPVHEVLKYYGTSPYKMVEGKGIQLNHYPDQEKSRSQYLPLLELAVKENPNDDRDMHYLGREYMFNNMWDKSIETLKKHIEMPVSTWVDERCASMRFISRGYLAKGDGDMAKSWLYKAIGDAPHLREPYIEFADILYSQADWAGVIFMCTQALKITQRGVTYICEAKPWGSKPYDLLSLAYFYTGQYNLAFEAIKTACEINPTDERLKLNLKLIEEKV